MSSGIEAECFKRQVLPQHKRGEVVSTGKFLRNLKKKHIAKRYEDDDNEAPIFGFKITRRHWVDQDAMEGNLSVNSKLCVGTDECSIAIQPNPTEFYHIGEFDLERINEAPRVIHKFVAQYLPDDETGNGCHYEILPQDSTVLAWQALTNFLDEPFPLGKLPKTKEGQAQAHLAFVEFVKCVNIRRWVRTKEGNLSKDFSSM